MGSGLGGESPEESVEVEGRRNQRKKSQSGCCCCHEKISKPREEGEESWRFGFELEPGGTDLDGRRRRTDPAAGPRPVERATSGEARGCHGSEVGTSARRTCGLEPRRKLAARPIRWIEQLYLVCDPHTNNRVIRDRRWRGPTGLATESLGSGRLLLRRKENRHA